MKFTLSWLKDHLETDASLDTIVETLTMIGLEVEEVDDKAAFRPFTVARVVSAQKHPNADKLQVLTVDTGTGDPVQVVCGAPNAREGLIGAFAAPGTHIPGIGVDLEVGTIRGVESRGMMCSERELQISDDHDGIIDLPEDAPVGASFADYAGLDDPVIDIGLTPNRPDCTGVSGIARDLAAAGLGTVKTAASTPVAGEGACPVSVAVEAPELCPGFALCKVSGVKNAESPRWMQQRLLAIGLRPINALVDITNYITFDRGRPLHVFDAAKVVGNLTVRRAADGETIEALDERTYTLTPAMCVIADDNGVESLAGVMGGERTGCDENTTEVLIESALWEPTNIATTGRTLGIITDARYRFERGVDPAFMEGGLDLATRLVTEICGGTPSEATIVDHRDDETKTVDFPVAEVERLTGIAVALTEALAILSRLGFEPQKGDRGEGESVPVTVPSWRPDVDGKADLVEEIMRIHGVNRIAPVPLERDGGVPTRILTTLQNRTRDARRALAARGMLEAVTWSFIPAAQAEAFGGGQAALKLANPIAADMSDMRPSLLPGLIAAAKRNADRGFADTALFEVSGIYQGDTPETQRRVAGGIRRGTAGLEGGGRHWQGAAAPVGVFDVKADALAVLAACGMDPTKVQIEKGGPDWYHPGRSGTIKLGPKIVLGHFGEFHPTTLEALDTKGPIAGFEIVLDAVPEPKRKPTKTKPPLALSPFQTVTRDFAFVVDQTIEAASILRAAAGADKKLITNVEVFDVFEGASLGEDKKSVAIEVAIRPSERTLTEEDLETLSATIVANVEKTTGGTLRG
ncbi:phenylalanine--tRNA ligase subunit beta [Pararhizobium mangrovi]|uniref:Phenylalanine--tRNA ligase beta subunit n=1 Tax=Pararhizobium mangrovi TaxID=2590452 RepID=A0A506U6L7_9HYPH|nr:phenylalanine--tRNA ligase subunit beta [Pararhizobium mangrovi]TPW28731.1 phenylalanine--tRNA ligase subunit beta [Pararhizobium mangrovi]